MERSIYLDNNATTRVSEEVLEAMIPHFVQNFGNASSKFYKVGSDARAVVDSARETVAKCIGAKTNEIYFTGSGCEADNWAIKGIAFANRGKVSLPSIRI